MCLACQMEGDEMWLAYLDQMAQKAAQHGASLRRRSLLGRHGLGLLRKFFEAYVVGCGEQFSCSVEFRRGDQDQDAHGPADEQRRVL